MSYTLLSPVFTFLVIHIILLFYFNFVNNTHIPVEYISVVNLKMSNITVCVIANL